MSAWTGKRRPTARCVSVLSLPLLRGLISLSYPVFFTRPFVSPPLARRPQEVAAELAGMREKRNARYLQVMQSGTEMLKFNFETNSKPHKRFFKLNADGTVLEVFRALSLSPSLCRPKQQTKKCRCSSEASLAG